MIRRNLVRSAGGGLSCDPCGRGKFSREDRGRRAPLRAAQLTPIWRFFGADEPNYATMKDGRAAAGRARRLKQGRHLLPRAQPAELGRRHAGAQVGQQQCLHRRRRRQAACTTGASSTASSTPTSRMACGPFVQLGLHAAGAVERAGVGALQTFVAPGLRLQPDQRRLGLSAARLPALVGSVFRADAALGAALRRGGSAALVVRDLERAELARPTGRRRPRSSTSCTTTRSPACAARCRLRASAARTPPGHGGAYMEGFLDHITTGKNYATGETGTPTDFLVVSRQGRAELRRRPRAHGNQGTPGDHRSRLSG